MVSPAKALFDIRPGMSANTARGALQLANAQPQMRVSLHVEKSIRSSHELSTLAVTRGELRAVS
jgi:hypothetical protein